MFILTCIRISFRTTWHNIRGDTHVHVKLLLEWMILYFVLCYTPVSHSFQAAKDAWRKSMRGVQGCKERLEGLEEELDSPRQELEEKKKEEKRRLKKVENLQKEIEVSGCVCGCVDVWIVDVCGCVYMYVGVLCWLVCMCECVK